MASHSSVSYRSVRTGGSSTMIGTSGYGGSSSSRAMGLGMGATGLSMGGGSFRVGSAGIGGMGISSGIGGMGISSRAVGMSASGGAASGGAGGLVSGGVPMLSYGGGAGGGYFGGVSPGIMASPAFTAGRAITSAGMSGVVGTLGPAGGIVPSLVSRDEVKNILGTLNQRLASYVDKVRQLTIENETLEEELKNLTGGAPISPDATVNLENETQVTEMLTEVSNLTLEGVRLEIDVDHLRATDLEAANDMRVDLESKFKFYTEELTFQKKTQKEELNTLKQQFGRLGPAQTSVIELDNEQLYHQDEAQVYHPRRGSNQGEIRRYQRHLEGGKFPLRRLCLVCQWQPAWRDQVRTAMADDFAQATVVRRGTVGGASSIGAGYGAISGSYSTGVGAGYNAGVASGYSGAASVGGGYSGGTSAVMEGGSSGGSALIGGQTTYSRSSMKRSSSTMSASGSSSGGYGASGHDTAIILQQ
uniref:IF rod domain-containing protein n=1 Tax=Eptatretus burgeri TaxID=7764 RepID=A0A8C4PWB7_EPTBU